MKTVSLSGSLRGNVGKKDAAELRRSGRVPGVLYGGDDQISFSVDAIAFRKIIHSPDVFQIILDLDGTVYNCIIQDLQFHPVTDDVLHIDMLQLFDNKEVKVNLPVRASGNSIGIRNGGRLATNFRRLTVKGLPADLPEAIECDISPLKIGDYIRVRDISFPGCTIMQADSAVVVAVKTTRAAMSAEGEEEEGEEGGEEGGNEEAAAEAAAE